MKRVLYTALLAVIMVAGVTTSCNKNDDNPSPADNLDRQPMLVNYADNYVLPAYEDLLNKLLALQTAIRTFDAEAPNYTFTNMKVAQDLWREAYMVWQKVDLLEFGPANEAALRSYMNTYPATISKVVSNSSSGNYDLEAFGNRDAQGFPAIDFLLNSIHLQTYNNTSSGKEYSQYLVAVIGKMVEKVTKVKNDWATYRNTFVNSTGTDVNSSLSIMVNNFVLYYERYLRGGKVGLPVGAMTGLAKPELVEAYYSQDLSLSLLTEAFQAFRSFYNGTSYSGGASGASMKSYLAALGTKDDNGVLMADVIEAELQQALAAVENLNGPLATAVQNDRTMVLKAYEEIQDVVPLLKVDMVSAFSISITYTDNDGD